jgi:hypothetical protein
MQNQLAEERDAVGELSFKLTTEVKQEKHELVRLQEAAQGALQQAKSAKKHALKATLLREEAEIGSKIAMDVVELQRAAIEESIQEQEQNRRAYEEAVRLLEAQEREKGQGSELRAGLLFANERLREVFVIVSSGTGLYGQENEVAGLETSTEKEIQKQNGLLLDRVARLLRLRDSQGLLMQVDFHHGKEGRKAAPRSPSPGAVDVNRRPATSQGLPVPRPLQASNIPTPNPLLKKGALFKPALLDSPAQVGMIGGSDMRGRGRSRGNGGVVGMVNTIKSQGARVLRSVDEWVGHTAGNKAGTKSSGKERQASTELRETRSLGSSGRLGPSASPALTPLRPLPPIAVTPELEPPITPGRD